MYYTLRTAKLDQLIYVTGLSEACDRLSEAISREGQASLWEDGKEIMHGHVCGNKRIINWRD